MQGVWGGLVEKEPQQHTSYSPDYRPDVVGRGLAHGGKLLIGDLKLACPLASELASTSLRGGYVGFGNTEPPYRRKVFGHAQRGAPGKAFDPADGSGYVSAHEGDYAEPLRRKHEVLLLLFETFGGFGPDVMRLLKRMKKHTRDKMTKTQYEHEASWSTRTWGSLMCQRLSVALHKAAAQELINELHWGMGPSSAPAPGRGSDEPSYSSDDDDDDAEA